MLDPSILRNELNIVAEKLAKRGFKLDIEKLRAFEERRKNLQIRVENLQAERNLRSRVIGKEKLRGKDIEMFRVDMNKLEKVLYKTKSELEVVLTDIRNLILLIPNLPDDSVPIGKNERDNIEIRKWGQPKNFNFKIRDHVKLGEIHEGLDFSSAAKITGSRFIVMKGQIAHLHRALTQFMMDLHTEKHGYTETYVPYLVNYQTLYGSGQLPKFDSDLFHIRFLNKKENVSKYALIPTAEVPLINLMQNVILHENELPIKLVAHSPCFRSEAGSYGNDSRGLIRMHQFDKVELVQVVHPENSMKVLEEITSHSEKILKLLSLPYRCVGLCARDMAFSACKTYDLEVWIPSQKRYREISSCSNVWDFQARRIQARFRSKYDNKVRFVHTLNGSGLAIGRTLVAVMENYQQIDGRIEIPKVLQPYMNGQQYIEKK